MAALAAPFEAAPFNPYEDAQGSDVSGMSPAAGGVLPGDEEEAAETLRYMQDPSTVRITRSLREVVAAATREYAVAYAISRFFYEAVDEKHIALGPMMFDGVRQTRCFIYTGPVESAGRPRIKAPGGPQTTLALWAVLMRPETRAAWVAMKANGIKPQASHRCHNKRCINLAHFSVDEQLLNLAREICRNLTCRQRADGQIISPCIRRHGGAQCILPVVPAGV